MKIGFLIYDLSSGGAERAAVSLANFFAKEGHQVEILTLFDCEPFYKIDSDVAVIFAGLEKLDGQSMPLKIVSSIKRTVAIRKFVKNRNLDIIVGMSFSMTRYAVMSTAFTNTKAVGTERNNPFVYKATKLNSVLRKIFYRLSDGFVFQTEKSVEFFTKNKRKTDIVIQNAVFNETIYNFTPPEERQKFICAVGRLCKQKRFDLLIKAFSMLESHIPDYKLIIFGEGEDREKLTNRIKFYDLQNKVFLVGNVPDLVGYINEASVFVLSSDFEGMPNALIEAMALGVPCVSTRCETGPAELIENGVNGLLTKTGSSKQLAKAIYKIISYPALSKQLSENAIKIRETNSIEIIGNQWLGLFEMLD